MLKLNNIDLETFRKAPNPEFGYVSEFYENKMISGKVRRDYKGKRFYSNIIFPYLTQTEINVIKNLQTNNQIYAEIDTPYGMYEGYVYLDLNTLQARYTYYNNEWVWINYGINLQGVDLIGNENYFGII